MLTVNQQQFDQGLRALNLFRKMIATRYRPVLRAATDNDKLDVQPTSIGAFTNGKTVFLPIPLALGDETLEHDKSLCGTRDPGSLEMLCPMCYVEDLTDGLVFHESAHITEGSFAKLDKYTVIAMVNKYLAPFLDALPPDYRKAVMEAVNKADTAMQVAGALDTWLPFATNVVEDIYVNRRLFRYRLGVEVPMRVHSRRVFEKGIEDASTGELHQWRDNDKDAQAIISAYLVGQNLTEFAVHLDPACNLVDDPTIKELVESIPSDCPIEERFEIAVKLLLHLRSLGFCPPPSGSAITPPPPPPSPPQGPDSQPQPSPPQGAQPQPPEPGQGGQGQDEGGEEQESEGSGEGSGDDDDGEKGMTGKPGQAGTDDGDDAEDEPDEPGEGSGKDDDDEGDDPAKGDTDGDKSEPGEDGEDGKSDTQDGDDDGSDGGQETNKQSNGEPDEGDDKPFEPPTDAEIEESARRAKELLTFIMGHEDSGPTSTGGGNQQDKMVLERVLKQEGFDHPSEVVGKLDLVTRDRQPYAGNLSRVKRVEVPRHMLTPSLSRLRVVFASNRKTGIERSLKSGSRLDTMHLYRAGTDDPRIFGKRNVPKARDWFVLVALDFSSSTLSNGADYAEKMAGHAIGDLLNQLGIRFSMYAHTAGNDYSYNDRTLEIVVIKGPDENWKAAGVQETLFAQKGRSTNLDGHSLEQYRKMILKEQATDKMLMYFTDGEMPCANFDEELLLLKENIEILRRHRVHLVGCGYRTDSPSRHGLDTIQYNEADDVASIVKGLEARLLQR